MRALIKGFIDGLRAEIALLEEEGRDQSFLLTSGTRDEHSAGVGGVYVFLLSDPLRLPEDANGTLHVGDRQIRASVVAQEGNRLWILLETDEPLPGFVSQARLVLSQTESLERLVEYIEGLDEFGVAPKVFGLEQARYGYVVPASVPLDEGSATQHAAAQALGSEVTFLAPFPGTAKT